ncbi:MAG: hypothetical protein AUK35_06265 [Zetaproteobacteria bacterium CG2_30_46_52]|nr:MAG: hypothetical protein AUK35_06265 [Zetaproteobacteria bacterium CG2_30_46_52]
MARAGVHMTDKEDAAVYKDKAIAILNYRFRAIKIGLLALEKQASWGKRCRESGAWSCMAHRR